MWGCGFGLLIRARGLADGEVDEFVVGRDALGAVVEILGGERGVDVDVGADGDAGAGGDRGVQEADAVEEIVGDLPGEEDLVFWEGDAGGVGRVEGIAEHDALGADRGVRVGGGGSAHGGEDLPGGGAAEEQGAFAEVAGEGEAGESIDEAVLATEIVVGLADFLVGITEVEFAVGFAGAGVAVVGVGQDIGGSDGESVGVEGMVGGAVAE